MFQLSPRECATLQDNSPHLCELHLFETSHACKAAAHKSNRCAVWDREDFLALEFPVIFHLCCGWCIPGIAFLSLELIKPCFQGSSKLVYLAARICTWLVQSQDIFMRDRPILAHWHCWKLQSDVPFPTWNVSPAGASGTATALKVVTAVVITKIELGFIFGSL